MPPRTPRISWPNVLLVLGLIAILGQAVRAGEAVWKNRSARDFATYHYATQVVQAGGSPYDTKALSRAARRENTRRSVHPFFYPPPFLGLMAWDRGLSLPTAYRLWFGANALALLGTMWTIRRWLGTPWWILVVVAASLTPIYNALIMGQANQLVLWPAVVGLASHRGLWVALAAMWKMSPALYLAGWVVRRQWRPTLEAVIGAMLLSALALVWVPLDVQKSFYFDIMPGFSSGEYHGLRVPINLPANHSIPDLFHQLWPGPDHHHLDPRAARAAKAVSLLLLGVVAFLGRKVGVSDRVGQANLAGALTVVMVITPVYAYEHHLAWLVLPGAAVAHALWTGRLSGPGWTALALVSWALTALHLSWLRALREAAPGALAWCLQESKFVGLLGLFVACCTVVARPPAGKH
ncbi:MAG: hypothetical protein CL927_19965 [Deltaproteobacteria bacterium]|nr:hypothetical protein [Deltaproteobacteria bacterium]HCH65673.1 hypothetical protein [Deltaproteobacteria bacterium]